MLQEGGHDGGGDGGGDEESSNLFLFSALFLSSMAELIGTYFADLFSFPDD